MKPVRALLVLVAALAWTITPYTSLMPVYAKDIYGGGPHTLGYLLSAAGFGALDLHRVPREPRDGARTRARHRVRGGDQRLRARGVRLHAHLSARACC